MKDATKDLYAMNKCYDRGVTLNYLNYWIKELGTYGSKGGTILYNHSELARLGYTSS